MQQTTQQKPPVLKFLAIISIAIAVILVLTITPWNIVPTSVTENMEVIAVTDYGCIAESTLGDSVVIENCSASVGNIISAKYFVPAYQQNGYYDRIHEKLEMINP